MTWDGFGGQNDSTTPARHPGRIPDRALPAPCSAQAANALTAAEKKDGWTLLFDGKSLDGWRGYKKTDAAGTRWEVKDGLLCLAAATARTRRARATSSRRTPTISSSCRLGLARGAGRQQRREVFRARGSRRGHRPRIPDHRRRAARRCEGGAAASDGGALRRAAGGEPSDQAAGEWNKSRVAGEGETRRALAERHEGAELRARQPGAGQRIAKSKFKDVARFGKLHKGHILLQDHGDAVCYRNVKIRGDNGHS